MRWRPEKKYASDLYVHQEGITRESRLVANLYGIRWDEAPVPRPWHNCWGQSKEIDRNKPTILRCACGSWRFLKGNVWVNRNYRRSDRWKREHPTYR